MIPSIKIDVSLYIAMLCRSGIDGPIDVPGDHRAAHDGQRPGARRNAVLEQHIAGARIGAEQQAQCRGSHIARRRSRTPPGWRRGRRSGARHEPCGRMRRPRRCSSAGGSPGDPLPRPIDVPVHHRATHDGQRPGARGAARRRRSHMPRRRSRTPPGWRRGADRAQDTNRAGACAGHNAARALGIAGRATAQAWRRAGRPPRRWRWSAAVRAGSARRRGSHMPRRRSRTPPGWRRGRDRAQPANQIQRDIIRK